MGRPPRRLKRSYQPPEVPGRQVQSNGLMRGSKGAFPVIWGGFLPAGEGGIIVDVGCGKHVWSVSDYGPVVRCDNGQTYPRKGGDRVHAGGEYVVMDATKPWPFEDDWAEAVVATEVIEHLEDPWAFMREACRVARRFVVLSTPNPECQLSREMFYRHGQLWMFHPFERQSSKHITPIFRWHLHQMAQQSRWKVEVITWLDWPFKTKRSEIPQDCRHLLDRRPTESITLARLVPRKGSRRN